MNGVGPEQDETKLKRLEEGVCGYMLPGEILRSLLRLRDVPSADVCRAGSRSGLTILVRTSKPCLLHIRLERQVRVLEAIHTFLTPQQTMGTAKVTATAGVRQRIHTVKREMGPKSL